MDELKKELYAKFGSKSSLVCEEKTGLAGPVGVRCIVSRLANTWAAQTRLTSNEETTEQPRYAVAFSSAAPARTASPDPSLAHSHPDIPVRRDASFDTPTPHAGVRPLQR